MAGKKGQNSRRSAANARRLGQLVLSGATIEQAANQIGVSDTQGRRYWKQVQAMWVEDVRDPEEARAQGVAALRSLAGVAHRAAVQATIDGRTRDAATAINAARQCIVSGCEVLGLKESALVEVNAGASFQFDSRAFGQLMGGQPALASGGSEPIEAVTVEPVQPEHLSREQVRDASEPAS